MLRSVDGTAMQQWLKRILWGLSVLLAVGYFGVCVWLRMNETKIIFPRAQAYSPPLSSLLLNQQRVAFGEADGTKLFAWIVPCLRPDSNDKWLLLFHGNGDNVSRGAAFYDDLREMGFSVMAPEYPGYLDSPGEPSEAVIGREAEIAYDYLRTVKHVPAKNLVIYGGSLGAAFAIDLASRVEAGALVEHEGFSSIVAMGQELYPFLPINLVIKSKLESGKKIGQVRMPILLLHSVDDRTVPFAHAERLYELAHSPKRLIRLRGSHSGPGLAELLNPGFLSEIVAFLNAEADLHLRPPLPSISSVITATIDSQGIEAALAEYRSLFAEFPRRYKFREPELNTLGLYLLESKRINDAIAVLRLNAEQFPQSSGALDSLGDAYAAGGNDADAIRSYERSLALSPEGMSPSLTKLDHIRHKVQAH